MMQRNVLFLSIMAAVLASCSTTNPLKTEVKPVVTKSAGLSEQNLEEGECALFLWAANGKREFIYFQKQDRNIGKLYRDDRTVEITTRDNTANLADAASVTLNYTGTDGEKVVVTGGYSGEIEGGLQIAPATVKLQTKDGWEQITPASGVFACL